jgi:alpha,alpha-trehalase
MRFQVYLAIFVAFVGISCNNVSKKEYQNPEVLWGELYQDVEKAGLFSNPKEFWDATAKGKADKLLPFYIETKSEPDFDLKTFVNAYMNVPDYSQVYVKSTAPFERYVEETFASYVTRPKDDGASLIPTRMRYIQGGVMFPEFNYFTSYFDVKAYLAKGEDSLAADLSTNAFQFIQDYGYVPYGNRSYYLGYTGFPMLSFMAEAVAEAQPKLLPWFGNLMARDYQNWMQAGEEITKPTKTAVPLDGGKLLNRFSTEGSANAYIDALKATEWKGTSRFYYQGKQDLSRFLPVDLNATLYHYEQVLSASFAAKKREEYAKSYQTLSSLRKELMDKYLYRDGFYYDYDFVTKTSSEAETLAAVFPILSGASSPEQTESVLRKIEKEFFTEHGLRDDKSQTIGSASMNYLCYLAAKKAGKSAFAAEIKARWIEVNRTYYAQNGHILARYNLAAPLESAKTPERIDAALAVLTLFLKE